MDNKLISKKKKVVRFFLFIFQNRISRIHANFMMYLSDIFKNIVERLETNKIKL
jgi:hypothetical protein